jgi:1,4-alpha-glucan branching enzyme
LWSDDVTPNGFAWIDAGDVDQSVLSFLRYPRDEDRPVACVANFTPVVRKGYRIGLPQQGRWVELLNTDAREWGGSGVGNAGAVDAVAISWHGHPWSASVTLPPLGVLWLTPG